MLNNEPYYEKMPFNKKARQLKFEKDCKFYFNNFNF